MTYESQVIEVMAMAIHKEFGNRSGRGRPWVHRDESRQLKEKIKDEFRAEARAALNAARELKRANHRYATR